MHKLRQSMGQVILQVKFEFNFGHNQTIDLGHNFVLGHGFGHARPPNSADSLRGLTVSNIIYREIQYFCPNSNVE